MAEFQPVNFDVEGSLDLARSLWQMNEQIAAATTTRTTEIESASTGWQGPLGDEFRTAASTEQTQLSTTAASLRRAAESWAAAWVVATNENRRREYQARVDAERNSRSVGERFIDTFVGDDSAVEVGPAPPPVTTPQSPNFNRTD